MEITVAVCTWNRAGLLDRTLEGFRDLRVPAGLGWEVLVVDNNSTDETARVIERYRGSIPLRGLFEPRPGKSHAANRAIIEARGDLILWTDDDVIVDRDWLLAYVEAARAWPDAAFFGGTVDPWFEADPPAWIVRNMPELDCVYAVRRFGDSVRPLRDGEAPFGANMAIRRSVLSADAFDGRLGPRGRNQVRGEETELLGRLSAAGHRGVWVGTARVRHFIPHDRLSRRFVWRWYFGQGKLMAIKGELLGGKPLFGVPRWVLRSCWASWLKSWRLRRAEDPLWLDGFKKSAIYSGYIAGTFRVL